jgi:selenocysteine-specific elongation factor
LFVNFFIKNKFLLIKTIEIPSLKVQKKIKSMQMFRKPIDRAIQGDRLGICVTNFDAKLIERGLACKIK